MNRQERRSKKSAKIPIIKQCRMNFIQIDQFISPLEDFLDQIEKDDVYCNELGEVLIDLPNSRVEDMARKGLQPLRAIDNIAAIVESYFQVVALSCSDKDLVDASNDVDQFEKGIITPLKNNLGIDLKNVDKAKLFCKKYRQLLAKVPVRHINRVAFEIRSIIDDAGKDGRSMVTKNDLRAWLVEYLKENEG